MLFHLGKLCEQVLVNKLKSCIQNFISANQFAYRPKTGTTDAILKLIDDVTSDLDSVKYDYVRRASVNFFEAFDRLQPPIVLDKMRKLGVNGNILDIIADFLQGHKQCVKLNECFSEYVNVFLGAPQGTKLGPILWLFYVNDLELENFSVIKYADDTSFYKAFDKHGGSVA